LETMGRCLPVYIMIDTSMSMRPFESILNDSLEAIYDELITSPRLSDFTAVSILSYNTEAEVVLKMTNSRSLAELPVLSCRGVTNLGKALRLLRSQIEEDIPRLSRVGRAVLRPVTFLLTDGLPTDDWKSDFAPLVDKSYFRHPNIIPFGYGEATADLMGEISTIPGAAFLNMDNNTAAALRKVFPALLNTLTFSARAGALTLPTEVEGFISVSTGIASDAAEGTAQSGSRFVGSTDPQHEAHLIGQSGGIHAWKTISARSPERDPVNGNPTLPSDRDESTMPVTIYLSEEWIHGQVEAAVDELLGTVGFVIEDREEPVTGSWFRRMRATATEVARSPVAREAALTTAHAADVRLVLAQDAAFTATLLQNLGPVIGALQPTKDAVLRVGALS
jgi:uncharacterized protein YegL